MILSSTISHFDLTWHVFVFRQNIAVEDPVAESFEPTEAESEDESLFDLFDNTFVLVGIAVGAFAFVGVIAGCTPKTDRPHLLIP
jgi:hypothetical protein